MTKKTSQRLGLLLLLVTSFASAQEEPYTFKKGDYSGIGKWYLEREISHVMGYLGMSWLERDEREKEENTTTLLKNMNITESDAIADIGAGSGYHVFKMALMAKKEPFMLLIFKMRCWPLCKIKKQMAPLVM